MVHLWVRDCMKCTGTSVKSFILLLILGWHEDGAPDPVVALGALLMWRQDPILNTTKRCFCFSYSPTYLFLLNLTGMGNSTNPGLLGPHRTSYDGFIYTQPNPRFWLFDFSISIAWPLALFVLFQFGRRRRRRWSHFYGIKEKIVLLI